MTHEEVMDWIVTVSAAALWMCGLMASILVLGFSVGYVSETYAHKDPRCVNSACDKECKPNARFVRHQGCVK